MLNFPLTYKVLQNQIFQKKNFKLIPIRYSDRIAIMKWRNEQIYHLRQHELLTADNQDNYFKKIVAPLFTQIQPNQILFSYLKEDVCIGYGGLVHINWIDKNAEISFIMNTELEKEEFQFHWQTFLELIEQVAFIELKLHKIFTYAFDIRSHLYPAVEASGFKKEAELKEHCFFQGVFKSVVLHSKVNFDLKYRLFEKSDKDFIFELNNEPVSRQNSFYKKEISEEVHQAWFTKRLKDENSIFYICSSYAQKIGLVRFQKDASTTTIGINILKEFRGKSLAKKLLIDCCEIYFKSNNNPILAYIKEENIASIKTFEKANFKFFKTDTVNKIKSLIYKLEKNEK